MRVPLPCKLGESICVDGEEQMLKSVTWFYWSRRGWEFTYSIGNEFATRFTSKGSFTMDIADNIIKSDSLAKLDCPLKGTGRVFGIRFMQDKLYADVIIESGYHQHIFCECDKHGRYKENGEILFSPCSSYDNEEKRKNAVLKKYHHVPIGVITR